jgi:hypothetical protein
VKPYCYPGAKRLAAAAKLAGFADVDLETAVAISGQETSGNSWVVGGPNKNGTFDFGAWQINSVHAKAHPEWFAAATDGTNWANHADNARMAFVVYTEAGKKFTPWVSFTTGRIKDTTGPYARSAGKSWLDWARQGVAELKADLAKGRSLEVIASIYLEAPA